MFLFKYLLKKKQPNTMHDFHLKLTGHVENYLKEHKKKKKNF